MTGTLHFCDSINGKKIDPPMMVEAELSVSSVDETAQARLFRNGEIVEVLELSRVRVGIGHDGVYISGLVDVYKDGSMFRPQKWWFKLNRAGGNLVCKRLIMSTKEHAT